MNLSKKISQTQLDHIDNTLIPCANVYFELQKFEKSLDILTSAIKICAENADSELYDRKKQELADHYFEVSLVGERWDELNNFVSYIDSENETIADEKLHVSVPDDIRKLVFNINAK